MAIAAIATVMMISVTTTVISTPTANGIRGRNGGGRTSREGVGAGQRIIRLTPDPACARPGGHEDRGREQRDEGYAE